MCGKKAVTTDSKLRSMPRRLTAFVGRLHIGTTERDLREFRSAAGTVSPVCKRLVAKDGRKFKTAAFMVSCDATSKDIFYDESIWPEGCQLRDWIFYDKKKSEDNKSNRDANKD